MAVTAYATGTLSTTGSSTEDYLTSPNVAGTFTLHVDTNDMAAGDIIVIRVYQMVLTGGTTRRTYSQQYENVQDAENLIKISVPISNELTDTNSLRFSVTQTAGTAGISLPWKCLKYA